VPGVQVVTHLIVTYGYVAVFVLVAVESLGLPLPGETALIVAGSYAGHTHRLSPWTIFLVAAAATVVGDNAGYWIGAQGGFRLLRRWGPRFRLSPARIKVGWYVFSRHGGKVVFLGRFVGVLRTYAAFLAGVNRMRWRRFVVCNVSGGVLWSATYAFGSYQAGNLLARASTTFTIVAVAGIVAAAAAAAVVIRKGTARLADRAEAAFPGPLEQGPLEPGPPGGGARVPRQ